MILKFFLYFFIWLIPSFTLAEPWQINDDENYITLKKNGEIQHGNKIHFNFNKKNGCKFNVFFFVYTMQHNPLPLSEIFENQDIKLNFGGKEILASVAFTSFFGLGEIAGIYIAQDLALSENFLKINDDMLKNNMMNMNINKYYSDYFDIPMERWDFTNFRENIYTAHNLCVSSQL